MIQSIMPQRVNREISKIARIHRHNLTTAEAILWSHIRAHRLGGVHFRRQYLIGNFIVDFCAPRKKLIIELDGSQHLDQEASDMARTSFLESKGYRVLRFWNSEVMHDLESVLITINQALTGNDEKE